MTNMAKKDWTELRLARLIRTERKILTLTFLIILVVLVALDLHSEVHMIYSKSFLEQAIFSIFSV